jgi:hypothetical protein
LAKNAKRPVHDSTVTNEGLPMQKEQKDNCMKHTSLKSISIVILIIPILVLSSCSNKDLRREMEEEAKKAKQLTTKYYRSKCCTDRYNKDKDKCYDVEIRDTHYPQAKCIQKELRTIKDKYYVSYFYNNKPGKNFYTMSQFNQYEQCISEGAWKESGHYFLKACDTKDPDYPIGKMCYNEANPQNKQP